SKRFMPETIKLELKNGDKVVKTHELSGDKDAKEWSYTFKGLPKYDKKGKEIKYSVDEEAISNYKKLVDGNVITNTFKTYAVGDYTWIDHNKDGKQDKDEPVLTGVKVELVTSDG